MEAVPHPTSSSTPAPPFTNRTSLILYLAPSLVLAALALLIQSNSPLIPAVIRTGHRLWKSVTSYAEEDSPSNPGAQRGGQSNPQSPSSSKRGGKKQQKRKLNKQIRAAAEAESATSLESGLNQSMPGVVGKNAAGSASNQVHAPVPPLHKSLQARIAQSDATPSSPKRPPVSPTGHGRRGGGGKQTQPQSSPKPRASPRPEQANSNNARSRSSSTSVNLNPHAAVYEFRAQYHDPLSSLTTTANNTPLIPPQLLPAFSPQPTSHLPLPSPQQQCQLYDAILVLDVEATCASGSTFDYPNEIIEWPVLLMKWTEPEGHGMEPKLVVVDEFRSFVRPTWRPQLTDFCRSLTGIQQSEIDAAPTFPEMLTQFSSWLQSHGLIAPPTALLTPPASRCASPVQAPTTTSTSLSLKLDAEPFIPKINLLDTPPPLSTSPTSSSVSSNRSSFLNQNNNSGSTYSPATSYAGLFSPPRQPMALQPECFDNGGEWDSFSHGGGGHGYGGFAWATDGPCDLRDFLVKQCFISKIPIPEYFLGDVIDVRRIVGHFLDTPAPVAAPAPVRPAWQRHTKRQSLNIPQQLQALSLGSFDGQQHRGIDDARNISRILQGLSDKGVVLEGNMYVNPNRRWYWMGGSGEVVVPPSSKIGSILPTIPAMPV